MQKNLAITSDLSSGGMVRQLLKKEGRKNTELFACYEDFSFGPLVPTDEPEQLLRLRHRYWCNAGMAERGKRPPEKRSLRKLLQASDHIEIMIAGEGGEQIFLLGLANLLRHTAREGRVVQLLQYPSNKHWHSLAMLNLEALSNRPKPTLVDDNFLTRLEEIWGVIVSNSPEALFAFHKSHTEVAGLPYVSRAIDDLIFSYPRADSGLTHVQERLLKATPMEWTKSARVVGNAMVGDQPDGRSFGDGILFSNLIGMADQKQSDPAIELRGERRTMRACEVRLTDFGEACLRGEINQVPTNGINTWVAGVHLNSAEGRVWFRNPDGTLSNA
ncbi:DUF1835 domain-containing protein [Leisingera aquaemixtae]|uniref:DUF1835 domain-containing protein n=1 Tax=Leisingera aquaemixtae TaxID=1396826 RepID=UPI0039844653